MAAEQAKNKVKLTLFVRATASTEAHLLLRLLAQGNEAFKQQKYPLALAHYSTAVKLDPSAFTYPLNRSAVHLKLQS